MGLPLERVLMDPNTGALGYGLEYTYSVMERLRLAALMGDAMTQQPMICHGRRGGLAPEGGPRRRRTCPTAWGDLADARRGLGDQHGDDPAARPGADILVLRHPGLVRRRARALDDLMKGA